MFEYYGPSLALPGIPVIQFIWLAIAALIGLAMVLDKNVLLFMTLIPTMIRVQFMRLWFLIRFMPMFLLTRWTMQRRMKKMAAEILKDLESSNAIVPQENEEID